MVLDEVLTFSEAAEKWGLADGKTIRKAVERQRFHQDEIKKSGNVWLTTYDAMVRVFGEPRHVCVTLYYKDIIASSDVSQVIKQFFEQATAAIACGEIVKVVESKEHNERILYIIKTMEELEHEKRRLQYVSQMK